MKKLFLICLFSAATLFAEELPPAQEILEFARAQLPDDPIRMLGSLKERAPNGFVKKELSVEMELNWGTDPATATYRIRDEKSGRFQSLEVVWNPAGPAYHYTEQGEASVQFDPNAEIESVGVTWADLSFSFLWTQEAKTVRTDKKLGKECYVISIARGQNQLLLWIEQETGRVLGAKEESTDGKLIKDLRVASVKEFDGIWMVKDLDIFRPAVNGETSLRINDVQKISDTTATDPVMK